MSQSPNMSEAAIQTALVKHLRTRSAPGSFWFHVPNGGWRSPTEAQRLKAQGVIPGVPDICIVHSGRTYFLELKAAAGRLGVNQIAAHRALAQAGAEVATAYGLDEALSTLEGWGVLKADRAKTPAGKAVAA